MKSPLLLVLVGSITVISGALRAQTSPPTRPPFGPKAEPEAETTDEAPVNAPPVLTEEQLKKVQEQLAALEGTITTQRSGFLAGIIERFRKATSSDAAALNFYLDCKKIVDLERKDMAKDAIRSQVDRMESQMEKWTGSNASDSKEEGDFGKAVRLQLEYLILTLEAHETPEEEMVKMIPKLRAFIQSVLDNGKKLKGRALAQLRGNVGNNAFVEAYQIGRYLNAENWSLSPLNFGEIWENSIFPLVEKDSRDTLPEQWDARINTENLFRKESMYEPEYEIWLQNEMPVLLWERAQYLYERGPSPINAMGDMLKIIREHPGHANAPDWLVSLRELVDQAAGANLPPPAPEPTAAPATGQL